MKETLLRGCIVASMQKRNITDKVTCRNILIWEVTENEGRMMNGKTVVLVKNTNGILYCMQQAVTCYNEKAIKSY